jgi:Rps23 Pro-64 3,4-dihydroxylase Tpa1-like proline 4-hydroxylase
MRIINLTAPFNHTIIYDYYSPRDESLIWNELNELSPILADKTTTGDPRSSGMLGLNLDNFYQEDRTKSHILQANRLIYNITDELKENSFMKYLDMTNDDLTQLNYYPDGSSYAHHADHATISAVTTFWKTPKEFTGGELKFTEYEYTPHMDNNTIILFPSFEQHEVTKVIGKGRFSLNQFYFINR